MITLATPYATARHWARNVDAILAFVTDQELQAYLRDAVAQLDKGASVLQDYSSVALGTIATSSVLHRLSGMFEGATSLHFDAILKAVQPICPVRDVRRTLTKCFLPDLTCMLSLLVLELLGLKNIKVNAAFYQALTRAFDMRHQHRSFGEALKSTIQGDLRCLFEEGVAAPTETRVDSNPPPPGPPLRGMIPQQQQGGAVISQATVDLIFQRLRRLEAHNKIPWTGSEQAAASKSGGYGKGYTGHRDERDREDKDRYQKDRDYGKDKGTQRDRKARGDRY